MSLSLHAARVSLFRRLLYFSILGVLFQLIACGSFKRNEGKPVGSLPETATSPASNPKPSTTRTAESGVETSPQPLQPSVPSATATIGSSGNVPRFGIILGPGGAKSFGHIGFLKNWSLSKVPIVAIAGLEWGSLPGSLYAQRGSLNDVEWQMMKIKPGWVFEKKMITREVVPQEAALIQGFLRDIFGGSLVQSFRVPFHCPSFSLERAQLGLMYKGSAVQVLSHCLPYPPLGRSYASHVAALIDLKKTADFLRQQGARHIVFVDVLGSQLKGLSLTSPEGLLWKQAVELSKRPGQGIDTVISIPLEDFSIYDFEKTHEISSASLEKSANLLRKFFSKWNL